MNIFGIKNQAVWAHEASMKAQAKKMNVDSLRNDKGNEVSIESIHACQARNIEFTKLQRINSSKL